MEIFDKVQLELICLILILLIIFIYGRMNYYKADAIALKDRLDDEVDRQREEVLYLRHQNNQKAAEFSIEN